VVLAGRRLWRSWSDYRVQGAAHVADVLGRCAAAPADDARSGVQETADGVPEILRAGGVYELALNTLR
jgi:hypothetical protein